MNEENNSEAQKRKIKSGVDGGEKAKKSRFTTAWQPDWLRDQLLKDWLEKHPTIPQTAICKYCQENIKFHKKTDLIKHAHTGVHKDSICMAVKRGTFKAVELEGPSLKESIQAAEMSIAMFIYENNLSAEFVNDFIPFVQKLASKPEVVKGIKMKEYKCSVVTRNVLYKQEFQKVTDILNNSYYSVLIDRVDLSSRSKVLCVSVRYIEPASGNVVQHLLHLIELVNKCTAMNVFQTLKKFFDDFKINMKNIVSLVCNDDYVELSNEFQILLRSVVPHLIVLNRVCNSAALITKKSCMVLPTEIKELMRSICTYFCNNPKRFTELNKCLNFMLTSKNKYVKPIEIPQCYKQFLLDWPDLIVYFKEEMSKNSLKKFRKKIIQNSNNELAKVSNPERILRLLQDEIIRGYICFLEYVSNLLNPLNVLYQKDGVIVHKLVRLIEEILRQLCKNFIPKEALSGISLVNLNISQNIKSLDDIELGASCMDFIKGLSNDELKEFRTNCLQFYVTAACEMQNMLSGYEDLFKEFIFLEPEVSSSFEEISKIGKLKFCGKYFSFIDEDQLAYEWENLHSKFVDNEKEKYRKVGIENFWKTVVDLKLPTGADCHPTLKKLIQAIFSFPHSNAELGRNFSDLSEVKDKKSGKPTIETLNILCFLRSVGKAYKVNSLNFEPDKMHYEYLKTSNLYKLK